MRSTDKDDLNRYISEALNLWPPTPDIRDSYSLDAWLANKPPLDFDTCPKAMDRLIDAMIDQGWQCSVESYTNGQRFTSFRKLFDNEFKRSFQFTGSGKTRMEATREAAIKLLIGMEEARHEKSKREKEQQST